MGQTAETYSFQTEARQLLDLMVHSVYSHKDIFLRELISNSSDALDKRRFLALTNPELLPADVELHIFIETDKAARTISVCDNGIGMSKQEVIDLVGTIAKSGTREFLDLMKAGQKNPDAAQLIGQFGIGFYSSFMVADKVTLVTRRAGEETAVRWESAGEGTYTIEDAERSEPGTTVTLHLKPEDTDNGIADFTGEWVIKDLVKKYSDFVAYPIKMNVERREIERDEKGTPKPGAKEKTTVTLETLNSMKAIWLRNPGEVSEDEYNEFYKHISHDWHEPLKRIQGKIEGTLEYRLLLFLPSAAPFDLLRRDAHHGIQLYVRRVFIMDDCKVLLPEYLRFVRGVVDSEDLSLNISREMLQQDRQIQRMRKGLVNKVIETLKQMRDNEKDDYMKFWREFGAVLKEGLFQDHERAKDLLDLVLAPSTHDAEQLTSLAEYAARMQSGQDAIYFMTGESRSAVENSPHLESFRAQGYEVLLLTDPIDEVWLQSVHEYDGKKFKSAAKGDVDLGTEKEKKESEESRKQQEKEFASLFDCLKAKLDAHVKEIRVSSRLTESMACLVGDEYDLSPQFAEMLRVMNPEMAPGKRILEVNPNHPVLVKLQRLFAQDKEDPALERYAQLLYGTAVLAEGGVPPDSGKFSKLIADLMAK